MQLSIIQRISFWCASDVLITWQQLETVAVRPRAQDYKQCTHDPQRNFNLDFNIGHCVVGMSELEMGLKQRLTVKWLNKGVHVGLVHAIRQKLSRIRASSASRSGGGDNQASWESAGDIRSDVGWQRDEEDSQIDDHWQDTAGRLAEEVYDSLPSASEEAQQLWHRRSWAYSAENLGDAYDREYDWAAEARKSAAEKGIQYVHPQASLKITRYQSMQWELRDGRWYGRWRWMFWDWENSWPYYNSERMQKRELAMHAWRATEIPQEIFLCIIECVAGTRVLDKDAIEAAIEDGLVSQLMRRQPKDIGYSSLCHLALVCRAWYTRVASLLYSTLQASERFVCSSTLRPCTAELATSVTVRGHQPFAISTRISTLLPNVVAMAWHGPDVHAGDVRHPAYSPSHARIYAEAHSSLINLVHLELWRCDFLSSNDLLQLLASLPSLVHVFLAHVSVARTSPIVRSSSPHRGRLQYVEVDYSTAPHQFTASLASLFTWRLLPSERNLHGFPGIPRAEAQVVHDIHGIVIPDGSIYKRLSVDSLDGGHTWVLWYSSPDAHIEFYATQEDFENPTLTRLAHIRHILIRVNSMRRFSESDGSQRLTELQHCISRLASVRKVTIESAELNSPPGRSILGTLYQGGEMDGGEWTCVDAHKFHISSRDDPAVRDPRSMGEQLSLLSPFWCLRRHRREWRDWLGGEYWRSLSFADKAGWDPNTGRDGELSTGTTDRNLD